MTTPGPVPLQEREPESYRRIEVEASRLGLNLEHWTLSWTPYSAILGPYVAEMTATVRRGRSIERVQAPSVSALLQKMVGQSRRYNLPTTL